ncbi:hypothetical protein Nepgr_002571 [Nepenthes gracilis]|uniref:Uncharacterized protein n=1 Tax=Nepenthes gracilis TaxID=150966 RepID=A0AAD3P7A4_NEPGR|nr:hypothetical protein Nepgr_002571 [Nepenthes gracilis]
MEMSYVKPNTKQVVEGMFIPKLSSSGATADSIALLGPFVMPRNLFLHSALVFTRKVPKSVRGINGSLNLKMKRWLRNLMIRAIAITPSLIVSIVSGSKGGGQLIIIASMILITWILGLGIIGINIYFLSTAFVGWLIHNSLPRAVNVFIRILVFPLMAIYLGGIIYLAFKKDKVVTFTEPNAENGTTANKADGEHFASLQPSSSYRDDLADIHE